MGDFQIRLLRRDITNEEILADLKRVAADVTSSIVTRRIYEERGQFSVPTAQSRFGSWNAAVRAAGLNVATRQDISNEELFENLAMVWTKLGHQPTTHQMSDRATGTDFSIATYKKRFGSWNNALLAFSDYISSGSGIAETAAPTYPAPSKRTKTRRTPREINWRLRAKILIRDSCICQMCGASPAKDASTVLHVDHVRAWTRGGETVEENLQTLCDRCNVGKSNAL